MNASGDDKILVVPRMSRAVGWPEHVCWAFTPTPDSGELAGRILRRDTLDPCALGRCAWCGEPLPTPGQPQPEDGPWWLV